MWLKIKTYIWNIIISLDQLFNVLLAGYPDETFSARTWRKARAGQWFWAGMRIIIDLLFIWDYPHCLKSYNMEKERRHGPIELRGAAE